MRALPTNSPRTVALWLCLTAGAAVLGQNEHNIWYFGRNAGLDFNGGAPVPLIDGALNTDEGCASIADANGALLFYSDGSTVWDRNHSVMPNGLGLMGPYSSTQSCIIVPKPGSSSIYYIFTTDQEASTAGLRYSELDMTLNGGFGDVTATMNVPMTAPVCEKVCAIRHANGIDYWVISHRFASNEFVSYHVSASGVNLAPVVSAVGVYVGGVSSASAGYLRASPNGSRLAIAHYWLSLVQIMDVDNGSGAVSNPVTLSNIVFPGAYGVEFSPSGQFLYVSGAIGPTSGVYQFDLLAGSDLQVNNSQVDINLAPLGGALQLGPDGRIYHAAENGSAYLDIIQQPDLPGVACAYAVNGVYLGGQQSALGLPAFIDVHDPLLQISASGHCPGDTTSFTIVPGGQVDSVQWVFGDTTSAYLNESDEFAPTHLYPEPGNYLVQAVVFQDGQADTLDLLLQIILFPDALLGADTSICPGGTLTLEATTPNANYVWQDGSSGAAYMVVGAGTYWVQVVLDGCEFTDTIMVSETSPPMPDLGADVLLCQGESILLSTGITTSPHLWSDGSTSQELVVEVEGLYWVIVGASGCMGADTVNISLEDCVVAINMPNVFSPNGNGQNEYWEPIVIMGVRNVSATIYNRWGQLVHSASGTPKWNGRTESNELVPEGTYYWTLHYTDMRNKEHDQQGAVTVLF